ncbi:hypothetical protein J437_LFUL016871 [Ladona fulva]|uniref:Uncharacterized protein n=1 Tax=Ladona fulva TaxID=123851 RepID=A0A8K0KPV9_LADFU|nr:hypothetical protein J437_LFUL016871 [Ladona fulva]
MADVLETKSVVAIAARSLRKRYFLPRLYSQKVSIILV